MKNARRHGLDRRRARRGQAQAKGCLKGAVVGGVAGHFGTNHALLGAAAGLRHRPSYAHKHDHDQKMRTTDVDGS